MQRLFALVALVFAIALLAVLSLDIPLLLLTVPILVYATIGVLNAPAAVDVTITRRVTPARCRPQEPFTVQLTLVNRGPTIDELAIRDPLPAGVNAIDGATSLLTRAPAGATLTLTYRAQAPRGTYRWRRTWLRVGDRFGIWERLQRPDTPATVQVMPALNETPLKLVVRPRQNRPIAGSIPARLGGSGLDFFQVRGYQPGDTLRRINWKATARRENEILTNEFEQERVSDIGLILDTRRSVMMRQADPTLFEAAIAATGQLATHFLQAGNRVSLLIYGDSLGYTIPGYGKVQRQRIIEALTEATLSRGDVFERLGRLPIQLFTPRSQVIFISSVAASDVAVLRQMRASGYELLVIALDAVAFEAQRLPRSDAANIAARIAAIDRALVLRTLRQAGIRVAPWRIDRPLADVLATTPDFPLEIER